MSIQVKREALARALKLAASVVPDPKKNFALSHAELDARGEGLWVRATGLSQTVEARVERSAGEGGTWVAHVPAKRLLALVQADLAETVELRLVESGDLLGRPQLHFQGSARARLPVLAADLFPTLPAVGKHEEARSFDRDCLCGALQRANRFTGDGKAYHHPSSVLFVAETASEDFELAAYGVCGYSLYREVAAAGVDLVGFEFRLEPEVLGLLEALPDEVVTVRRSERFTEVEGEAHRLVFSNSEVTMASSTIQGVFEKAIAGCDRRTTLESGDATVLRMGLASLLALEEEGSVVSFSPGRLAIEGPTCRGEVELQGLDGADIRFRTCRPELLEAALRVMEGDLELSWKGNGGEAIILAGQYRTVILAGFK